MKYYKLLLTLLLLPILAGAQVYDSAGFVKVRIPPPVVVKDTIVQILTQVDTVTVVINHTDTVFIPQVIYKDTCIGGDNPTDPPPVETGRFDFTVQQRTDQYLRPSQGLEMWNNAAWNDQHAVSYPPGNTRALNEYYRFNWNDIETNQQGVYDWSIFDREMGQSVADGRMFSFGVMSLCTGCDGVTAGGAKMNYPLYLHNLMQSEASNSRDWVYDGSWIPNWNSPNYLARLKALYEAIAKHIEDKGWSRWLYYVDIRGYGDFGEWHNYPYHRSFPTGRAATAATLKRIIDIHKEAFPDVWLVNVMGVFDQGNASLVPAEVTYHALTSTNNKGRYGWRRDNWGDAGYDAVLANNSGSYNGVRFRDLIMDTWKHAPVLGEPSIGREAISRNCGAMHCDLPRQVALYHASMIGNGNYPTVSGQTALISNVRKAAATMGDKLTITGGSFKDGVVTINWRNSGLTPIYEDFTTYIELRTGGQVIKTYESMESVTMKQPGDWVTTDNLTGLPSGTYDLHIVVKNDQRTYPLGITTSKVATIKL